MITSTQNMKQKRGPIVLIIRDGWGYRRSNEFNAIKVAKPVFTEHLMKTYPHTLLDASQQAVGLPKGYMGNSEVGHMTIGSGQIIKQSLERINASIKDKSFFSNEAFLKAINYAKKHQTTLHLMGLLQSEGVHAHEKHLYALLKLCKQQNFSKVLIHIITDGRDAPVHDSIKHIQKLKKVMKKLKVGTIASITGRFYAMDRDKRWQRTHLAYKAIIEGKAEKTINIIKALEQCYKKQETDEFITPHIIEQYKGVQKNDSIIFFNFRTDRTRQLTKAVVEKNFKGFKRSKKQVLFTCMTNYYKPMNATVAFKDIEIKDMLGKILSQHHIKQLRISETEKYAHVTFFFNGQIEKPFPGEDRILIHSPKVRTYDLKPEMSAMKVTEEIVKDLKKQKHQVIITNLVNGDMVGHTGIWQACLKAVKTVDTCVKSIVEETLVQNGTALIIADHGNIEDLTEKWRTSHTTNKIPCILVSKDKDLRNVKLNKGFGLKDVAPTILDILNIPIPKTMNGKSLIKKKQKKNNQKRT